MRSIVSLMLLAPAFLFAVSMQPMTALPENGNVPLPVPQAGPGPTHEARFTIGIVDTVGGTTYDWAANGPALRMLVRTPGRGVHSLWMFSAATTGSDFPDRNMRYNFYDYSAHAWNWPRVSARRAFCICDWSCGSAARTGAGDEAASAKNRAAVQLWAGHQPRRGVQLAHPLNRLIDALDRRADAADFPLGLGADDFLENPLDHVRDRVGRKPAGAEAIHRDLSGCKR